MGFERKKDSFSQLARDVLDKTKGDRKKAIEALKKAGCTSASGVVGKVAVQMGYESQKKSKPKVGKKATTSKKVEKKAAKPAPKKAQRKAEPDEGEDSPDEF